MTAAAALFALALPAAAQDLQPLPNGPAMATRAGIALGGATACKVARARVSKVRRETLFLVGLVSVGAEEMREARRVLRLGEQTGAAEIRSGSRSCADAIQAFGEAERN